METCLLIRLRLQYSWAKQVHETSPQIVIPGRAEREPGMTKSESCRMSKGLIDLISILDIEPLEVNLFRGNSPKTSWQRVFAGQVIGQAMVAACPTAESRLPHSLHVYFILPGDPPIPIIYDDG